MRGGGKRFAVFFAGLAGKYLHVNQARQYGKARAIQRFGAVGNFNISANGGNFAVAHQQAARYIQFLGRIDQSGIGKSAFGPGCQLALGHQLAPPLCILLGRLAASASSAAMRTATPIST